MIEERTVIKSIEITESAALQVRIEMQVLKDGQIRAREYHRTVIEPDVGTNDTFAVVNAHLKSMGWPEVEPGAIERIQRVAEIEHTAPVKKAWAQLRGADAAVRKADADMVEAGKGGEAAKARAVKIRDDAIRAAEAAYRDAVEVVRRGGVNG